MRKSYPFSEKQEPIELRTDAEIPDNFIVLAEDDLLPMVKAAIRVAQRDGHTFRTLQLGIQIMSQGRASIQKIAKEK